MDTIAVLIPCYNEAATIEKVVRDFHRRHSGDRPCGRRCGAP